MNNFYHFRLVDGSFVFAELLNIGWTETSFDVLNPLEVMMGERDNSFALGDFLPFSDKKKAFFPAAAVISFTELSEHFTSMYGNVVAQIAIDKVKATITKTSDAHDMATAIVEIERIVSELQDKFILDAPDLTDLKEYVDLAKRKYH